MPEAVGRTSDIVVQGWPVQERLEVRPYVIRTARRRCPGRLDATGAGDLRPVLGGEALAEVRARRRGSLDDLGAMQLIGMTHWLRYLAPPAGEDERDLAAAVEWLGRVLEGAPSGLAASLAARRLRSVCVEPRGGPPEAAEPEVINRAVALLEAAVARSASDPAQGAISPICAALQPGIGRKAAALHGGGGRHGDQAVRMDGAGCSQPGGRLHRGMGTGSRPWEFSVMLCG